MKNTNYYKWTYLVVFILFSYSCTKNITDTASPNEPVASSSVAVANLASFTSLNYNDSIERPTILGVHLPNPYIITNMKQAYKNITGQTSTPAVTHLYVRFKPSTAEQLSKLDSVMDLQALDLFDTPLDYQILQEGNYYQDPSIPMEQVTWQYAVVLPTFQFPTGITYEILASIHIPDNTTVEQEAERLAGLNADGDGLASQTTSITDATATTQSTPSCPVDYTYDPVKKMCVPISGGGTLTPPDPTFTPGGRIMVFDTQLDIAGATTAQPVRTVGVIAKRWFKVQRTFTDANGNFNITKNFRRRVKLVVK
ncbi:MAG: hypothetical protein IT249_11030, partial [Chitinophagaceae bacterium]|nr:hypothetical protein [Chitinophagaceae bacterium]